MQPRLLFVGALALMAPLLATPAFDAAAQPEAATDTAAPTYRATITTTRHGIPHIVAEDFGSLGFGSGYAAADSSICTLADTVITGRGERSRYFGEGTYDDQVAISGTNLQVDTLVGDLRNRHVVEKLLADPVRGPSPRVKRMVKGYTAGINAWIDDRGGADGITDPECSGADHLDLEATPLDLWYGVYLANIMASTGHFAAQIVDASPASLSDPGLPQVPGLPAVPSLADLQKEASKIDSAALMKALGKDPDSPFGSNATAIGGDRTTTRRGMVLGNPHFPWRGRFRFTQQHLTIPGSYDVAGASLIGSPAVNIGWNDDVAWSHTVSTAYRFTPYEYLTLPGTTTYVGPKGPRQLERRLVDVQVRQDDGSLRTVREDVYRTEQGYVIDAPDMLMPWGLASLWAIRDANGEQLRTIDTFLDMGRATSVRDLIRRQDKGGGIPWVNTIAADRAGDVAYADHSVVPNVPNSMLNTCMTPVGQVLMLVAGLPGLNGALADGPCAWKNDTDAARPGVLGPKNLPVAYRRDWVANANDSYWLPNPKQRLEGFPKIIGCERCERSLRTRMVYRYPSDALVGGRRISPAKLASFEYQNRVMGAEVMRVDGALDQVCQAAGGGDACDVLRTWDGRSDTTSVGNHIFEEFVKRLPGGGIWKKPFDAKDPLNTPRGLVPGNQGTVKAMKDAIAHLREQGIAMNAPWGSLQVAGDRGAPPIHLGGGSHAAGNANVLTPRTPEQNDEFWSPVTYGSSHVQSVAFLADGRVSARTILTYSQSENPRSPWSSDQTRLYAAERWVTFPWTARQIAAQQVSKEVVTG